MRLHPCSYKQTKELVSLHNNAQPVIIIIIITWKSAGGAASEVDQTRGREILAGGGGWLVGYDGHGPSGRPLWVSAASQIIKRDGNL